MKRKLIALCGTMALVLMPAVYSAAQEMDDYKDADEPSAMQSNGPGARADREPEMMKGGPGGRWERDESGTDGRREGPGGRWAKREKGMNERQGPGAMSEEETLAVIKKNDPALAEKLAGLKTAVPGKYRMMIMMSGRMLAGARFEREENFEKDAVRALSLEFDTKELGLKYDKAADSEKPAIKSALKGKIAELFDLRLKGQEIRILRMEKDLARLKKNLENRKAKKASIVEERLGQLTGEGVGW